MPGGRPAGPLSQEDRPLDVDGGTLPVTATPLPGPLKNAAGGVAGWPVERKLLVAAERAAVFLPADMREQFLGLFSPGCIAITAGVLALWAGSHAFGVGQVADVVMFLVALGTIGWQAVQVAKDIGSFLAIASSARSDEDLDRAAMHLAAAVSAVGVTVFAALIFKAGAKAGGKAGTLAAARAKYWGRTTEEWLIALTKPKAPPLVRKRLEVALDFFKDRLPSKSLESIEGYVKGIDLAKPVGRTVLGAGEEVVMYGSPGRHGLFYTKPGTAMDKLAINPNGRQFVRYRIKKPIDTLESRAAANADTWTQPGSKPLFKKDGSPMTLPNGNQAVAKAKYQAGGGGVQYIIPDMEALIRSGAVEVVKRP